MNQTWLTEKKKREMGGGIPLLRTKSNFLFPSVNELFINVVNLSYI